MATSSSSSSTDEQSMPARLMELEREAKGARELMAEVVRLVGENGFTREDFSFELINQAARTVKQQLELAREAAAAQLMGTAQDERGSAQAVLENASTVIRRVSLFVQLQVFVLDGTLHYAPPSPRH
jgi:hypothetical protein